MSVSWKLLIASPWGRMQLNTSSEDREIASEKRSSFFPKNLVFFKHEFQRAEFLAS